MLTTQQAADELGISPLRVRQLIHAKRLKATKAGRDWLIQPRDLATVRTRTPGRPRLTAKQPTA